MTSELLTEERRVSAPTTVAREVEIGEWAPTHVKRAHRLKVNAAAWALGTFVISALWVANQWQANGAFERIGNESNPGDWNPTVWAFLVGISGLVVGVMALRVRFERPTTEADVDREAARLQPRVSATGAVAGTELRRFARARLERVQRLKFHVAAWVLGMTVLTPIWALIEWQDNGRFERFGGDSQPGEWEPWILYVAGIWALVIGIFALQAYFDRPPTEAEVEDEIRRHGSRH